MDIKLVLCGKLKRARLAKLLFGDPGRLTKILQHLLDAHRVLQLLEFLLAAFLFVNCLLDFLMRKLRPVGTMVAEAEQVHEDGSEFERHELGGL